jgi:hypothetical protein
MSNVQSRDFELGAMSKVDLTWDSGLWTLDSGLWTTVGRHEMSSRYIDLGPGFEHVGAG